MPAVLSERFEPKIPEVPLRTVQDMGLKELERIRLILRGGSVIEWRRLHFRTRVSQAPTQRLGVRLY